MAYMVYEFKGKPYEILSHSKIKLNDVWEDVIIYKALYHNPDGQLWVRLTKDFKEKFKPKFK